MPPKIRELISQLESAGFTNHGGKGSYRKFRHKNGVNIVISGKAGADAKHYQVREVNSALKKVTKNA
ncbi:MAG: type II toxin-antitoxin system HicA family toxin [Xanthomonadales bacterium]|nr:type II toxin-antitoxin system HicA family toxin [Xanthomonadales bacterium]